VIERGAPAEVHGERHLTGAEEAEKYLEEISHRKIFSGVDTKIHVHTAEVSDVARSIAEHSAELAPDLVIMTTHGKRDARQMIVGTVAQQVIGLSRTPVLVIRPTENTNERINALLESGSLILVPIDADPSHQKSVPIACDLARVLHSRVHLLIAVPKTGDLRGVESAAAIISPSAMRVKLEMDTERANEYLQTRTEELAKEGFSVTSECVRGDAANAIVELADRVRAGLIVIATHGKSGSEAFWNDSVAARVVTRTHVPVLLVPIVE
jgi:nucleotide-binding universal stress UspA family protein